MSSSPSAQQARRRWWVAYYASLGDETPEGWSIVTAQRLGGGRCPHPPTPSPLRREGEINGKSHAVPPLSRVAVGAADVRAA